MPIRTSKPKRKVPLLTPDEEAFLQGITDSKAFTLEKSLATYPPQLSQRMTTGPERTPLKPWTQAQAQAQVAAAANLYAKRIDPEAHGLVLYEHTAKGFPAYEIEVIDTDGITITVDTVGHAWLMTLYQQSGGAV
jgi:hypothetical protein